MTIPAPHTLGTIALSAIAGISIASVCGLRAFLPLLALALGAHLGWIALDPRAAWLGSDAALWALVAATLVELAADKVPGLDHLLDVVATFVRPVAAAFAAWATVAGVHPALAVVAAALLGAGAVGVHAARAKVRLGSTALTLGTANPLLSFAEDAVTATMSALALLLPLLALAIVVLGGAWLVRVATGRRRA